MHQTTGITGDAVALLFIAAAVVAALGASALVVCCLAFIPINARKQKRPEEQRDEDQSLRPA